MKDKSGEDIDIWGDESETKSTPIPEWWERRIAETTKDTKGTKDEKGAENSFDDERAGDCVWAAGP